MSRIYRILVQLGIIFALLGGTSNAQNDTVETQELRASFEAYRCSFIADTNSVRIQATLLGANGLPVPSTDIALTVDAIGQEGVLLPSALGLATIDQRDPLQMIVVLDTTETVPVTEIIDEMVEELFSRLRVEDEVALITFSQEIQPRTAFYTDKNRLVNEHVLDLQTLEGNNRLYSAILEATSAFPLEPDVRRVVLVLTDSGRRDSDTTAIPDIIERAQLNNVEIFPIGFYTRDFPRPNREDFFAIANGTGGYAWLYDRPYVNRADVAERVGGFLNEFVDALAGELSITVDIQSLETSANDFIDFVLRADTANDTVVETVVTCPVERLEHSIVFADDVSNLVVRGTVDVGVRATSDFDMADTAIVFRVNDEVVQDTGESIYTFDSQQRTPGYYTLVAELRDRRGNVLATTPNSIELFAQQSLTLQIQESESENTLELILTGGTGNADLGEARFTIAPEDDPDNLQTLGTAPFDANNRATLMLNDVRQTVNNLFPNLPIDTPFVFGGEVAGVITSDPLLALSDSVMRVVDTPSVTNPVPRVPAPSVVEPVLWDTYPFWLGIGLALLLTNMLLFNAVRRARIRRLIAHPDNYEFSPRLMTMTVYRDGLNQSHTLTKRTIFIGRGSSNDINLGSDSNISRSHGVIMWRNGHWYYTNRKPRLLSRINDRNRRGLIYYRLKPFTEILIGNALLVFHENSQQDIADFVKTNI